MTVHFTAIPPCAGTVYILHPEFQKNKHFFAIGHFKDLSGIFILEIFSIDFEGKM